LLAYEVVNMVFNAGEMLNAAMDAGSAFISMSYAEKNGKATKSVFKLATKANIITGIILAVSMTLFSSKWPSVFGIEDPEIIELAIFTGRILPITYIFVSIVTIFTGYYPCIDRIVEGNILGFAYTLLSPLVICVPLAYFVSFKAMIVGFIFTPALALIIMCGYFKLTNKKGVPLFLPENSENVLSYNLILTKENIVELKDRLIDDLDKHVNNGALVREIGIVIEDGLLTILKQNKRKIMGEVTVLFNNHNVHLTIKDDGIIFDLIKASEDGKDLAAYTVDRMISNAYKRDNDLAISFNRNSFSWEI